ncbi:MAG: DsrE family protein [Rhodocyclaceae bacterium]|nr:DsrE family protein [Rhodocyclaceae bacterium]
MPHRLLIVIAIILQLLVASAVAAGPKVSRGAAPKALNRVVIQINEDDARKWHAVLANIHNIQAELGAGHVKVAVVVIGPGLGMLMADALTANGVQDALAAGAEFVACGNSMKAQKIDRTDLIDGVGVVTAGYVEIMRRQQQGWSYLRP